MYKSAVFTILFLISLNILAQEKLDSIFTITDVKVVNITEVTETAVKFSYPGENLTNTMNLVNVDKIVFRTGRIQSFKETVSLREVKSALDWEYVTLTQVESDVKGLYRLDDVSAKAKAMTGWTGVGKMENRASQKLKIEAAMNGANVVYITQQQSNTRTQNSTSSSVVSGLAYSNRVPDFSTFSTIFNQQKSYRFIEKYSLGSNSMDMKVTPMKGEMITFDKIENVSGLIYIYANIDNEDTNKFRVSYFDSEQIILVYRTKKTIYNLVFQL